VQNKTQFQQHLQRLNEKVLSLETERKNLLFKTKKLKKTLSKHEEGDQEKHAKSQDDELDQ
jgi:hypothetical protein